jgi:uncharacterized protein (DUF2252 family)
MPTLKSKEKKGANSLLTDWHDFFHEQTPTKERIAAGKKLRGTHNRTGHGSWEPNNNRPDPIDLLLSQDESRQQHLTPLRYERMMSSPFAFFRGSALIMASDLSFEPHTNLTVQLCGDCHLSNFGVFATPERNIIFDLNDFDETLPGPFEWDLKRLAASFAIAAEYNGFTEQIAESCVAALAKSYREKMEEFSQMSTIDVWYHRVDWEYLVRQLKMPSRKISAIANISKLKAKRSHAGALAKLTEVIDGKRRIKDQPPLIYHSNIATGEIVKIIFNSYATSLWESRQRLLQRYHFVDVAAKIVGVGSIGTVAGVVLLHGEGGDDDYIFLQLKQATESVLERYLGRTSFKNAGQRVVNGQRLLQAASDMFLGWTASPTREYYIRQLMDVKASVPIDELDHITLEQYAEVCGYALARAHARTGDPAQLYGYLGKGTAFDEALSKFALAYVKRNEQDHDTLLKAVKSGKVSIDPVPFPDLITQ